MPMPTAAYLDEPLAPHPLLSTTRVSDFSRNFAALEKHSKRPYSICRVISGLSSTPCKLDGFEAEVDQELRALNRTRNTNGVLIPIETLSPWRRDLTTALPVIQTTVSDQSPISFLRAKTICGRLGATFARRVSRRASREPKVAPGHWRRGCVVAAGNRSRNGRRSNL
jgi:hypothetical protein